MGTTDLGVCKCVHEPAFRSGKARTQSFLGHHFFFCAPNLVKHAFSDFKARHMHPESSHLCSIAQANLISAWTLDSALADRRCPSAKVASGETVTHLRLASDAVGCDFDLPNK